MSKPLRTALAILLAAALTPAGCGKKPAPPKPAASKPAASAPASQPASRAAATQPIDARAFLPGEESFLADLKALTASHRLAGFGRTRPVVKPIGGELVTWDVVADEGDDDPGPGSRSAGKRVLQTLQRINQSLAAANAEPLELYTQEFPVVAPVYSQCELHVDGRRVEPSPAGEPIYPVRHNLLQASVTPEGGIEGPIVYGGKGDPAEYGANDPKDKIVLIDADCDQRWLDAFAFGARAVIFVGLPDPTRPVPNAFSHVNVPANLPRFYVPYAVARQHLLAERTGPDGRTILAPACRSVKLLAACQWKQLAGRNVVAVLRGSDPNFNPKRKREAVVLAAPLDSLSEVPALSVGARDAANAAALLQLADHFARRRPMRDMAFCFFDGQAANHMGARAFYAELFRGAGGKGMKHADRKAALESERHFLDAAITILDQDNTYNRDPGKATFQEARWNQTPRFAPRPTAPRAIEEECREFVADKAGRGYFSSYHKATMLQLANEAQRFDGQVLAELRPARVELRKLADSLRALRRQRQEASAAKQPLAPVDAKIADAQAQLKSLAPRVERFRVMDLLWNCVQRLVHEEKGASDSADIDTYARLAVVLTDEQAAQDLPDLAKAVAAADIDDPRAVEELIRRFGLTDEEAADDAQAGRRKREIRQKQVQLALLRHNVPVKFKWLVGHVRTLCRDRRTVLTMRLLPANDANDALRKALGPENNSIVLHVSVNLGDARTRWTFVHGEDSKPLFEDNIGTYGTQFKKIKEVQERLGPRVAGFDARAVSPIFGADGRLFCPARTVDSGAVARTYSLFNLAAITLMDPLPRQGQVADVPEALKADALLKQAGELALFLGELTDHKGISQSSSVKAKGEYAELEWKSGAMNGPGVQENSAAGAMRQVPVRHKPVAIVGGPGGLSGITVEKVPPGFEPAPIVMTDANGLFEFPGYNGGHYAQPSLLAADFDPRGLIEGFSSQGSFRVALTNPAVELTRTRSKTFVNFGFEPRPQPTLAMKGLSTAAFQPNRHFFVEVDNVLVLMAPADEKTFKLFNRGGPVVLANEPTKEDHQGRGIPLADPYEHPILTQYTVRDLGALDEYRLNLLKDNHINQESLWDLFFEAQTLQNAAQQAAQRTDAATRPAATRPAATRPDSRPASQPAQDAEPWSIFRIHSTEAAAAQIYRDAYSPLAAVLNDLVTAVVLLLLLAVPFAYAMERLLVGTPHIYRQIGWFTFFFLAAFALLYLVNPAFKLAATPIIIFLAFAIILLSSLVIFIMLRKLQAEIKKVQGLAATVHSTDVSRLSTMMAAVNMGISTMRRRPLRTLLTAITVVLLTFTILTFASFGSSYGNRRRVEGPLTGVPRVQVRHQLFSPIGEGFYKILRGSMQQAADVVPRVWVSPLASEAQAAATSGVSLKMFLSDSHAARVTRIDAAMGIDPRDLHAPDGSVRAKDILDALEGDVSLLASDGIFLTDAVRMELGLARGDIGKARVLLRDRQFTFAGIVKTALAAATGLDGASILPVNYQASGAQDSQQQQQQRDNPLDAADVESAQFVHYNVDQVVIISAAKADEMNGHLRTLSLYPRSEKSQDLQALADQTAKITQLPVYVGDKATAKVERLILTSLTKASGWRDLLIPVILGGMIVFATMLGSVSDREREIYTFSSLGLAPPHVASLFFAEASVYAVVGGMGGYLLGQVVARFMGWLGGLFQFTVVSMNYSSTNAIVTILIVMGTVLISTIYPAIKASRSANPGIQRSWRIPKPQADLYDLVFPFTVSAYDITGVVSFLKEHFDNYSDTSLGVFATTSCRVFRQPTDMLGFRAEVALAPFDLGVNHGFALLAQPSDIEGIDELRILICRRSGAHGDWRRSNRVFINDLRKQLLIWRSLTAEVMDQYRRRTLETWDSLPVEAVNEKTIGETP